MTSTTDLNFFFLFGAFFKLLFNNLLLPDCKTYFDESSLFCKFKAVRYKIEENLQKPPSVSLQSSENEWLTLIELN